MIESVKFYLFIDIGEKIMKKIMPVILIVAAIVMFGCSGFDYDEEATAADIQGDWSLDEVSGIGCCSGLLTYTIAGTNLDNTIGEVTCSTNSAVFDYEFDNTEGLITIDGSTAENAGLVDGSYYVFIDGSKMAWRFENNPSQTAYIFVED